MIRSAPNVRWRIEDHSRCQIVMSFEVEWQVFCETTVKILIGRRGITIKAINPWINQPSCSEQDITRGNVGMNENLPRKIMLEPSLEISWSSVVRGVRRCHQNDPVHSDRIDMPGEHNMCDDTTSWNHGWCVLGRKHSLWPSELRQKDTYVVTSS